MSTSIANTPFSAFLQHGGELTPAERLKYITSCTESVCTRNRSSQRKLLQESIDVLFSLVLEKINVLPEPIKKEMLSGFQRIKALSSVSSLQNLNLISLQIVLLFEWKTYWMNPAYKSTYTNEEYTNGCRALLKFPEIWLDKNRLRKLILEPPQIGYDWRDPDNDRFETYFWQNFRINLKDSKFKFFTGDDKNSLYEMLRRDTLKNIIKGIDEGGCCPVKPNSFMLVPLGELTIVELLDSFFRRVYLCGIVFGPEYADGTLHTPFEFLIHDIIHADNFMSIVGNSDDTIKLIKAFFEEIKKNQSKMDVSVFDKLMLVLFIVVHESMNISMFEGKIVDSLWDLLSPGFLTDIPNWKNPHFFGGLLPPGMIEKSDEEIKTYLKETFNSVVTIWNRFLDEKNLSFLLPEEVIPSMGRNSAMEFLLTNGGKRRKTKRTMKKRKTRPIKRTKTTRRII